MRRETTLWAAVLFGSLIGFLAYGVTLYFLTIGSLGGGDLTWDQKLQNGDESVLWGALPGAIVGLIIYLTELWVEEYVMAIIGTFVWILSTIFVWSTQWHHLYAMSGSAITTTIVVSILAVIFSPIISYFIGKPFQYVSDD